MFSVVARESDGDEWVVDPAADREFAVGLATGLASLCRAKGRTYEVRDSDGHTVVEVEVPS
ncbi:hypothetical protein K2Z84_21520 [Candidatus Binatia bacterium]|nr:hypothetical protein [Candidatus Binatia bacterium]